MKHAELALGIVLIAGCPTDPCEALCPRASSALEACLPVWGLDWGDELGYDSPEDHNNWCETWVEEQRILAATSSTPGTAQTALDERCDSVGSTLEGGACDGYWILFSD